LWKTTEQLYRLWKCAIKDDDRLVDALIQKFYDIMVGFSFQRAEAADPWCDTTTPGGRLMLTVLGDLAEFERELIKARTSEGRERAKRAGIRMGRKPKLSPHQIAEVRGRRRIGKSCFVLNLLGLPKSIQVHLRILRFN
jgi:DNA invertase Pin-like site-specific DNA recombinase